MAATTVDLQVLEELLRKVVREEIRNVLEESATKSETISDEAFEAASKLVFQKHKKVLDALA